MAGEKGDCGMFSRRGVREVADRGAVGFANCDGGMMIRGDSGFDLKLPFELARDNVL